MEQVVRKAQQLSLALRDKRVDWLFCVKKPPPSGLCNPRRKRARAFSTVEGVVAIPEWFPSWKVVLPNRAHED